MTTFVQGTGAFATTSGTNIAKAYTSNVTAGNLLLMHGNVSISAAVTFSVTDTLGNTWAAATAQAGPSATPGFWRSQIFWTITASSGANTVTFTRSTAASTDERVIIISEWSPTATWATNPVDGANTGTGSSANPSISVTVAAGAVLLTGTVSTTTTATPGSGFLDISSQDGNDAEYQLAPSSGSIAVPFVMTSGVWAESAASFLEAAAGATSQATGLRRFPLGV